MATQGDKLLAILARFHREIVLPDIERVVGDLGEEMSRRLGALGGCFSKIYKGFDRLETEYHALVTGLKRAEERLDKMALRSELLDLRARVEDLKAQGQALEDRLNA